jgi:hypothetical protein
MRNNLSGPSTAPVDLKLTEQTLLKETDLQRCIDSLQYIICDLLIENEKLRQHVVAGKSTMHNTSKHLRLGTEGRGRFHSQPQRTSRPI